MRRPQSGQGAPGGDVDVGFVRNAVLAGVGALVDEAPIAERGEEVLDAALVAVFGGADEVVVGEAQRSQRPRNSAEMAVANSCGVQPGELGGALDLLAVLVGAGEEPRVDAKGSLAARDGIADDGGVGVAQVRTRIDVIDGRGEIKAG